MRTFTKTLAVMACFLFVGTAAMAQFSGQFAPANWTTTNVNSDGTVNTAGAPASIAITGPNNGSFASGYIDYSITVPNNGTISFNWVCAHPDAGWDDFQYAINGVTTFITDQNTSGSNSVNVTGGSTFSFRITSDDNTTGGPTVTISNFLFVPNFCGQTVYDSGGPAGNYQNNENFVQTYCPQNAGDIVTLTFTAFNIETSWDALYVFNGPNTASPLFASGNGGTITGFPAGGYWGSAIPGPFTSTDASGCLTVQFLSDPSVTFPGWEANVTCAPPPPPNNDCAAVTPQPLSAPGSLSFSGTSISATDNSVGQSYGAAQVWEAFTLSNCADVTMSFCGSTPVMGIYFVGISSGCPASFPGNFIFNSNTTFCGDGNPILTYNNLQPGTYYVPIIGGINNYELEINATPIVPLPTITASGPTTFCTGGSVTLTVPATASEYSVNVSGTGWMDEVEWDVTDAGGNVVASGGPYGGSGGGSYTVNFTSANAPFTFNINTVGFAGDNTASYTITCVGSGSVIASGFLSPNQTASVPNLNCGPTYVWSPAAGLNTTVGLQVTATPSVTTTYTVTVTDPSSGCTNSQNITINIIAPDFTINSVTATPNSVCEGGTVQLNADVTPGTLSGTQNFTGGSLIIPSSGNATPFPSVVTVSGLPASGVTVANVQVNNINHTWPSDIDMWLVSPGGQIVMLMSDAGGSADLINVNLVFQDGAPQLPNGTQISSGTFSPTDIFPGDVGEPLGSTTLISSFTGNLNGNWQLFVFDDAAGDLGNIGSWGITFNVPGTSLTYSWAATPGASQAGISNSAIANPTATLSQNTSYAVTVTDQNGCSASSSVAVTVNPPAPAPTVGATVNICQGSLTGQVTASAGGLNITWFDQPTGGTQLGTGTSLNVVGTSVMPGSNTPGTYTVYAQATSAAGCDGPRTAAIVIVNPTYSGGVQNSVICQGQSINFGGSNYAAAGSYTHTFQTIAGCDSIVTLNLSVNPTFSGIVQNSAICQGDSINFGGTFFAAAGSYTHTFQSINGCDSTVTMNLAVNPTYSGGVQNTTICEGESVLFGGTSYNTAGSYPFTFQSINGCDSTVTLNLTVNPLPVASFTVAGTSPSFSFNSTSTNASSVSWNFGDGSPAVGNASTSHTYTTNGTFTVTLTATNSCGTDTQTEQVVVFGIGITEAEGFENLSIFPNPTDAILNISFQTSQQKEMVLKVIDAQGKTIMAETLGAIQNEFFRSIDVSHLAPGMYNLSLEGSDGSIAVKRFVKM